MRKLALVFATAATLAVTAVATLSPAHARYYGYGPGIFGGLVAGALIAGIASSAYGYGPGYYGGYPAYYGGCLLYTSPSPRDRTRSRMPSSA